MRFCVLASGSGGNATYIDGRQGAFLIDCGLSSKECLTRLSHHQLDAANLRGIVLTHEHRDHMHGVQVLAQTLKIPVLTSPKTWRKAKLRGELISLKSEQEINFIGFNLRVFGISHDAADPLGVVVEDECGAKLGYCTDLGQPTPMIYEHLHNCSALVLESNHDPELLRLGPYPGWLKMRVASERGHLSNAAALDILERLWQPDLSVLVAAHISQVNNSFELVQRLWLKRLAGLTDKLSFYVARQEGGLPIISVEANRAPLECRAALAL